MVVIVCLTFIHTLLLERSLTAPQPVAYNHRSRREEDSMTIRARTTESTLVGRSAEIGRLDRAIRALRSGEGHVLMLAGEPGIGKSTLARIVAGKAREQSLPVYWGFSWEAGGAPAYWPWTQLLSSLVTELKPPAELTTKMQQLLPETAGTTPVTQLRPDQARFQLLESVRRLLDDISRKTPFVLILEDLHAADSDSLQLLHYVARHVSGMPVLIIGTYRDVEARAMAAADPLWRTCRDAEVMMLPRLAEQDVRDYLAARNAPAAADEDVLKLLATTDGNPLFLTELVGYLAHEDPSSIRLPENIQQVIRQQIARLPKTTAALIAEAAALGREFDLESLAAVSSNSKTDIDAGIAASIQAALIRKTEDGHYRFSHALHRDVLYQDLGEAHRSSLHVKYSELLREKIDRGEEDRWTELAKHLSDAGSKYRDAAIAAWRHAAKRAIQRLAFDDAVASLNKAVTAFGDGPKYLPADRCELLLEYASAELLTGATANGHEHCRDAFEIARTLEDPVLMSRAALTWGSAIVVATVNAELVAALQGSLAAIPQTNTALRSQVLARLAGAMQPSLNPAEPMDMAREAISLARTTGDENVLFSVLRSAISALMDFAPASERMPLNLEFSALAGKFGDVPGQFRSNLRLMMDACEAADRNGMDQAIDSCDAIARRIALPHYQWRVASARAMQATIDGDFAKATQLLDVAQEFADRIDDLEAKLTIPLQRFVVLIEWESPECESLTQIESQLEHAYESGLADARFFVAPFINSHKFVADAETAWHMLRDRKILERTFAGGDRFSLCRLGEVAAIARDTNLATRVLDAIEPYENDCGILGLMGTSSSGPVAWSIGSILSSLGRHAEALEYLCKALDIAASMRAAAWTARIHATTAKVAGASGNAALADKHNAEAGRLSKKLGLRENRIAPAEPPAHSKAAARRKTGFAIQPEGELWRVSFNGVSSLLRATKGVEMLALLTAKPDTDLHVLDLSGARPDVVHGDAGPTLDTKARTEYESRLRDLGEELEEAEEFGDTGRVDVAQGEIDFITRELSRAFGLGGRSRRTGDAAERARVNVRRRLKDAIARIAEQNPDAGRYLENTIKTGAYCRYTPM